jgi:hypothetical protein
MAKCKQAQDWERWIESSQGVSCANGEPRGLYLMNRLHRAFDAGYDAAKKPGKDDGD